MDKLRLATDDWVVVCDGRKALFLQNEGDEKFLNLKTREIDEQEAAATREIGTDRPGRVQEMATTARSAVEQTDWHLQEEEAFLKRVAGRLGELLAAGRARHFVLVAPPRALGILRKHYSGQIQSAVLGEINHDLVHLPVDQIEERLAAQP